MCFFFSNFDACYSSVPDNLIFPTSFLEKKKEKKEKPFRNLNLISFFKFNNFSALYISFPLSISLFPTLLFYFFLHLLFFLFHSSLFHSSHFLFLIPSFLLFQSVNLFLFTFLSFVCLFSFLSLSTSVLFFLPLFPSFYLNQCPYIVEKHLFLLI